MPLALLAASMLALSACGADEASPATPMASTPATTATAASLPEGGGNGTAPVAPAASPAPSRVSGPPPPIALEPAFGGRRFERPTEAGPYPGGRFFVVDQFGLVVLITPDGRDAGTLLDLRDVVLHRGNEEGLLSLALDPRFAANRYLYVYYSMDTPRRTRLARFTVLPGDSVDRASELVILEQEQPFANHNGGHIRFGPEGESRAAPGPEALLYLGFGDGGSSGDPRGNAQNLGTWLGKIIRIDVRNATPERPYEPRGHPALASGGRPEILATGFRNPWRMAFDWGASLALIVADVGERNIEEIDLVQGGGNYGWSALEGNKCFKPALGCARPEFSPPVATYTHREGGCSVTGGEVYRGRAAPGLEGYYLFADFCSGLVWAMPVGHEGKQVQVLDSGLRISSFFRDEAGEVYAVAFGDAIQRIVAARR